MSARENVKDVLLFLLLFVGAWALSAATVWVTWHLLDVLVGLT